MGDSNLANFEKYKEFKDYVVNEVYIKEKLWRTTDIVFNEETGVIGMGNCSEDDEQLEYKYFCSDCGIDLEVERFSKIELIDLLKTHFEERHKLKKVSICHICKEPFPDEDHGVITEAGHWLCHNCNDTHNWDWEEKRYYLND